MNNVNIKYILVISIILAIATYSLGQTNETNSEFDLEGTWVYKNDSIEFQTKLSKVTILTPTQETELILGFSKLAVKNKVIYNNINRSNLVNKNRQLTIEEFSQLVKNRTIPEITVNLESMEGDYFAYTHSKKINLKLSLEEDVLVLHFLSVSNSNEFPNFIGKEDKTPKPEFYNIPEVPSTWILKRLKE